MPEILSSAAAELGATDLVVYLVDFGQTTLEPLPDRALHAELSVSEPVSATMAGRAFTDQQVLTAQRDDGLRVWVPVLEGSDRTGVIALSLPEADDAVLQACEELGLLAGYLIAAQARCTDVYNLYRRRRSMSLAASMQWDLLPPLVLRSTTVAVAGLVEPAYDVGGDCFDYADNGAVFDLAIMDAMGHGLRSAALSALVMGAYRHSRREARSLDFMHQHLDVTLRAQYDDASFVTGVLARIDTDTGVLTWTNAGHPPPLLVRGGQVIRELTSRSVSPWGLIEASPNVQSEPLEPGDSILLYTDGVTEARTNEGELFGLDRLIDITQNHASDLYGPEELVRQVVRKVLEHNQVDLRDDAAIVAARWSGPPAA